MMPNKKYIRYAVLVKFWQAFLLVLCCSPTLIASLYSGGDKCDPLSDTELPRTSGNLPGPSSYLCLTKKLHKGFRVTNLTTVSPDSIEKLSVQCSESYHSQSELTQNAFQHLDQLTDLSIYNCKLVEIRESAFINLRRLRNLTINTMNSEWASRRLSLSINAKVFRPVSDLERLDLSSNNIWEVPSGVFCSLSNLKMLNLSNNHLQDLRQLGFSGAAASYGSNVTSCRSDLTYLDISSNDVDVLSSEAVRGLTRLETLVMKSNNIGKIDDRAFDDVRYLQTLDISNNKLVALPENVFMQTLQLMYIYAQNNSLTMLPPGIFRDLSHLVMLDLSHNDLGHEWLTENSFKGLIRLMHLDLSHNKILHLNQKIFKDLYSAQMLKITNNQLKTIADETFTPCVNLHRLDLSHNELTSISDKTFAGVSMLSYLAIGNNKISKISYNSFANLTNLADLDLNENNLKSIPEAISSLRYLKTLDLGDNKISSIDKNPVNGLQFLYGLRLGNNSISGNISKETFLNIPSLKVLNMAVNKITRIESGAFDNNYNLQAVRLDNNLLTSMNDLFENLPKLTWLNVSVNRIELFDYNFVPQSLVSLDLHQNKIPSLGNALRRNDLVITRLDASFNKIKRINAAQIPNSVKLLFLNDNKLSIIEPSTFINKTDINKVELYNNRLKSLDMKAIRLHPVPSDRARPQFLLGGNSFICDCHMEWLQRINLKHSRFHPKIVDLDQVYCQMPFIQEGLIIPMVEVDASQFLCQYESHCFALCHCCEYDACDCEMTCPDDCGCYHDHSWNSNIVNCSSHTLERVPDRIPMDATEVYVDGNNFINLTSHSFIGRKHIKVLFVNSSKVSKLDNETFSGLTRLTILHLEDNLLTILHGFEFKYLTFLRELYLHNNQLKYIQQHTFVDMSHLEVLTLHNNKLINFPVWRMVDNPYLRRISIADNPWICQCQYIASFEIWLSDNIKKVSDGTEVTCQVGSDPKPQHLILDLNATNCLNSSTSSTVTQPIILKSLIHPVLDIAIGVIIIVLLLFCIFYRNTLRVWFYSKCGVRLCKETPKPEDTGKLFDAFVSYSSKDERWVNHVLAQELESCDRPYKMCLHYRDFPVTAYITDTIVDAVESSKRTIIVLSKNFIENEWCRFQFKSAHHEVLKKKRKRLIVIVLGDIPHKDLDPDLRMYLKRNTCIHSDDKQFWQKLRFALPETTNSERVVHTYSTIPDRSLVSGVNKYTVNSSLNSPNHHTLNNSNSLTVCDGYCA